MVPHARGDTLPEAVVRIQLEGRNKTPIEFDIESVRPARDALLLRLVSVGDRNRAEELAGSTLSIREADLPPPEPGECYLFELIGARVCDESAIDLGSIAGFLSSHAGEILRIDTSAGERLLPLESGVLRFDREKKIVVVRVPKGLW